jgi:regulator of nucleoside diphosphate kinase
MNDMNTLNRDIIFIAHDDFRRLSALAAAMPRETHVGLAPSLRDELARATTVDRESLPPGVVTVNSRVRFVDEESGVEEAYTITWPDRADGGVERVSVLAPIGTALLGYREGDELSWPTPGGIRRLRILSVEAITERPAVETPEEAVARILYGLG